MPKRPVRPEDLLQLHFISDPQISPDGSRILFGKRHTDNRSKAISNLFSVDRSGTVKQWTQGESGAGSGRWSPDGQWIAFVSGRDKPASQIFLIPTSGGEAKAATHLPEGSISTLKWSPDSTKIAFSFRETQVEFTEAAKKQREETGASQPPRVVESAFYRYDGDGYFLQQRYAIYVLDLATGETNKLYDASELGYYAFDWAPNSQELAIAHNTAKRPLYDPPQDRIFRVDMNGQAWMLESLNGFSIGELRWSPDGKAIAFLGEECEDDPYGVKNTDLYVLPADGGEVRCLSGDDDYCLATMALSDTKDSYGFAAMEWTPDCRAIYVSVGWHGATQIGRIAIDKARVEFLTTGEHNMLMGNLSNCGRYIPAAFGTATRLSEIVLVDLEEKDASGMVNIPPRLTSFNDSFHAEVALIEPEETWIESGDGTKVHLWTLKPVGYREPNRYAAVLEVHGGPHSQYGCAYFHEFQVLAAAGYVVVYSNPRGSKGYGEDFCAAIRGRWGTVDWEDVQAVTRWMQHQPYIHPGQIGIMGGSYGGYMTNWAVGHCNDFRAAITDRCVSNLVSKAGNSDYVFKPDGYWPGHAFGGFDRIKDLWTYSPIAYFDQVQTPMLVIHSEGDLRCNIEQGEQVFTALQVRGIESRMVRYPVSTSHGMSRGGPADLRLHRLGEILAWWKRWLG